MSGSDDTLRDYHASQIAAEAERRLYVSEEDGETMSAELLPCPFCGGEASKRLFYKGKYRVHCNACDAHSGDVCDTEAEAIAAWNTREERTCRIAEYDEAPLPVCSECGAVQPDDFTVYYCWNCGAKVVEK